MSNKNEIVQLLDSILSPHQIKDYTYNGLQFEGKDNISHIACAVDVSLETLQKAEEIGVDLLITHHGMIWGGLDRIVSFDKKRLAVLFKNDINLYCSHLPLDIHPKYGNNAILMELLDLKSTNEPFFQVGYFATCQTTYSELIQKIKTHVSEQLVTMPFGPTTISQVAICSGGATLDLKALTEAYQKGVHTIISGETNSLYYHYAKELSMNIICAGHYATEVFGVQALTKELKNHYPSLKDTFIDFPTGF